MKPRWVISSLENGDAELVRLVLQSIGQQALNPSR